MTFNVAKFASNIGKHGTLQTNKFEVKIFANRLFTSGSEIFPAYLDLNTRENISVRTGFKILNDRIDSVKLPGVTLDTYETRRYGVGPNIKIGTNVRFEPFSISVITDKNYDTYKYFYTWINSVFDFSGSTGRAAGPGPGAGLNPNPSYLTSYKKDYFGKIEVDVFEGTGQLKAKYFFYDAFPIGITDPALSWRDNNTLHKFDVTFSYTNWEMNNDPFPPFL